MLVRSLKAVLSCVVIGLAAPDIARADCAGPSSDVQWTYPDESTPSVPPDTVFWAVAHRGDISVEVDGVALEPREQEGPGRFQFAPADALSEGEHELVARIGGPDVNPEGVPNERHVRFNVVAGPAASGDVSVSSVTVYPYEIGSAGLISPPQDEYDTACSELAVRLEWTCDDIIPYRLARIAYASEGAPVAYLVQGDRLVPPGCASLWVGSGSDPEPARFRAAAILPTGLGEEHVFAGAVEDRSLQDIYPERFQDQGSAMCSLPAGGGSEHGLAGTALLVLATCGCGLRRRRARAPSRVSAAAPGRCPSRSR